MHNKCSNCGTNIFSNTQIYCISCHALIKSMEKSAQREQEILDAYEKVTGFDPQTGCDYCGVNNYEVLWEHKTNCIYYRPEPKNKQSIDCTCTEYWGYSFSNPEHHHPQCPVYLYYGMQKSIPQSDEYNEAYKQFIASQEKQLQEIANKIAIDQFLKKGIPSSITFDIESVWIDKGKIKEPKKETEIEEVETIEKPKKRKINLD